MTRKSLAVLELLALVMSLPGCVYAGEEVSDAGAQTSGEDGGASADVLDGGFSETDGNLNDSGGGDAVITGVAAGEWTNVSGPISALSSECGNVTTVSASSHDNRVIVGVTLHGVYATTDGGASWQLLGMAGVGDPALPRIAQFLWDPDQADSWYLAGTYHAPGVYKTTDDGATFQPLGSAWHNDSVSVDFTDPERKTIVAGTHEQGNIVWRSLDGGETWTNVGETLPDGSGWSHSVHVVDADTYLVGTNLPGIYRTTDAGESWTKVSEFGGGGAPLKSSDGSIYWATGNGQGIVRSDDDGETWEAVTPPGYVFGIQPVELPDGRIATRANEGVVVSADKGLHWKVVAPREPFDDPFRQFALAYSKFERAFFVAQWTCSDNIPEQAVVRFDWDYEAE